MLVSLQSYTLLHFKRKQLLRWNVCQLSEDRNIRNIPSVTKGETHTNRLSFRLNKHKVSYFCLLHFYFQTAHAQEEEVTGWKPQPRSQRSSWSRGGLGAGDILVWETAGMLTPIQHGSPKSVVQTIKPNSHQIPHEIWPSSTLVEALRPSRNITAAFQ